MFQSTEQIQPTDPPKNELVAALLSLFILGGVGQMYLGQTKKGIILVVATIVTYCLGLGWIVQIVGAWDAYKMSQKLQSGQSIGDMEFFWESTS